ncbi:hypothetical protein RhiJN_23518 [Ceratobasidium sp. AG-Ba]|nr:hypothetical protein RhiJN_23518 [Ceratobasidium sp. AG-Ba]
MRELFGSEDSFSRMQLFHLDAITGTSHATGPADSWVRDTRNCADLSKGVTPGATTNLDLSSDSNNNDAHSDSDRFLNLPAAEPSFIGSSDSAHQLDFPDRFSSRFRVPATQSDV